MPLVHISKPRSGMHHLRAALRFLPGPRAAVWPLVLAWILICGLLAFLPATWLTTWRETTLDRWFAKTHEQASRLTQIWEHTTVPVPAFTTGEEPAVQGWLGRESMATALVDSVQGEVWIRQGMRLRPARNAEEARVPADWARRAMAVSPEWTPRDASAVLPGEIRRVKELGWGPGWLVSNVDPFSRTRCAIVTFCGRWCLLKSWMPGSREVEQWLQETLKPGAPYRFGISNLRMWKKGPQPPESGTFPASPASSMGPTPLEATNPAEAPYRVDEALSQSFGGNWQCILQMSPDSFQAFRRAYVLRRRLAWTSYALVVAASGLALALILFTRNREKVLADRLASLTHSLKTPLAVLKLRCDTALNLDLSRASQEARLLEIRSEVDQLVRTIEGGLEEMRTRYTGRGLDRVDSDFFEQFDEDLTPAFEGRGRMLEVYSGEVAFRCSAPLLRAALATLAENALSHGAGRVAVKATREKGAVTVTVSDEGGGMTLERLQGLRSGITESSAGEHHGHGLGLLVLARITRQEGWGLAFRTGEGGFSAILSIPA